MAEQFRDECLAETHDFVVALAFGVEVGTAFAGTHRQCGQGVLEGLFKRQEFQDGQVDGWMEAQTALVGTDHRAVLDAVAAVDLDIAAVINPGYPELDDAFRLDQTAEEFLALVFRIRLNEGPHAFHHFGDCLMEFWLVWVALFYAIEEFLKSLCHFKIQSKKRK